MRYYRACVLCSVYPDYFACVLRTTFPPIIKRMGCITKNIDAMVNES